MKRESYLGKKVLIVGLGTSGRAAAYFLLHKGAIVCGVDRDAAVLQENEEVRCLIQMGLTVHLDHSVSSIQDFDFIVMSPGIPPSHPLYMGALQLGKEILGEIELGFRNVENPIVGITGTNGKTTVTLLIAHVLNHCGKKARALGNVGIPLTREILSVNSSDILVVELSSYQLETLYQPVLDAAVILNITPDHLDRYENMFAYAAAKCCMGRCLKEGRPLYLQDGIKRAYPTLLKNIETKQYGYSSDCFVYTDLQSIFINGKTAFELPTTNRGQVSHNIENMMAAYAICREMGVEAAEFAQALQSFKKPPHRIEFITEKNGVRYYDDSKGTNIDAVIRAVQSLQGSVILIAGGVDKGSAYTPWIEVFTNKVKCICAIGQAAGKIQQQLSHCIPVNIFKELDQAVRYAASQAQQGDNILLSPGCSSFDMFRDYAHRGKEFQCAVYQL